MDRKEYTPTKQSKLLPAGRGGERGGEREARAGGGELTIVRECEALRAQARQLEMQNRQSAAEVERLRFERGQQEARLAQKASFEEEAASQLQKEKSYQVEMMRLQNEEELTRVRREYEARAEEAGREARGREAAGRELAEKRAFLEARVGELRAALDGLEQELLRLRDANCALSEHLSREEFANKKLEKLEEELERHKAEMETEIHILLDIEAEKSTAAASLDLQLHASQASERALQQKLALLTDNFLTLEQHIELMKDRLAGADSRGEEIDQQLQRVEYAIAEKEQAVLEQRDRELRLRQEIDAHKEREGRRLQEVQHLMAENDRAYRDLALVRHRLYDVSIEQAVDL